MNHLLAVVAAVLVLMFGLGILIAGLSHTAPCEVEVAPDGH